MATQKWHDAFALKVMRAARGDLMLVPHSGALAYREDSRADGTAYAKNESVARVVLAVNEHHGWRFTAEGAQYILDCFWECFSRYDVRQLKSIAAGRQ